MRVVSWNVNGIRSTNKRGLFLTMMNKLKPDILCLQETKAEQHQSEVVVPGYEEYWNSALKKGYSGTAIFSAIKPKSVMFDIPGDIAQKYHIDQDTFGNPNTEGRVIAAEYDNFYIVNVYTPNSKDDLSRLKLRHKVWDPAFLYYCKELDRKKPVIFCGDLNVAHTVDDLAHPKENEGKKGFTLEEREGIEAIISAGFVDSFRLFNEGSGHYTWWSPFANARERNIGWRIDYIFVSKFLTGCIKKAKVHPDIHGSDHCPISVDVQL